MVVTLETKLPTEEELTMPELKLSAPALRAGAFHLGKYCQDSFNVSASEKRNKTNRFSLSMWRNKVANAIMQLGNISLNCGKIVDAESILCFF